MPVVLVVDAYFASVWNRLDLVCLLSSLESAIHLTGLRHTVGPTIMTALGIARSLRPIRLVTRSGALRELVDSLVSSARNVVHVLAWLFSVYVIFAVVGNALFGGRLRLICLPYMSALYVCLSAIAQVFCPVLPFPFLLHLSHPPGPPPTLSPTDPVPRAY